MVTTLLVIDGAIQKRIKEVIEFSTANPTPLEVIKKLAETKEKGMLIPDLNSESQIDIPGGLSVVYTHEEQPNNVICRHLSVSSVLKGRMPSEEAVMMMMNFFGFENLNIRELTFWIEDCGGEQKAVNIIEPLS